VRSRFHKGAEADLAEDVEYYDLASYGLGNRFLSEVQTAVAFVESFPEGAPSISGEVRGKGLNRFPHTLLYVIERNEVVILSVAHQSQDLQEWLKIVRYRRTSS
jgi:plasmid stabilization system protein ParE